MAPQKVILDCDPGLDDAVSILLAIASPEALDILAITTVAGNVVLKKTTRNACVVRDLGGAPHLPVYAGCSRPMLKPLVIADEVHGDGGLGDYDPPPPSAGPEKAHAVDYIIETLRASNGDIVLVPTGPLTNIAMAIIKAPDICEKIKRIVLMGGASAGRGNITPSAEFNIYVDPHAAKVVLESGIPITAFGLDVTHQALCNSARMKAFADVGTPVAKAVVEMLQFANRFHADVYDGEDGTPLHDPCTAAFLIQPELFASNPCFMDVVTEGAARGHTPVDTLNVTDHAPNVDWVTDVDDDALFALVTERIARL